MKVKKLLEPLKITFKVLKNEILGALLLLAVVFNVNLSAGELRAETGNHSHRAGWGIAGAWQLAHALPNPNPGTSALERLLPALLPRVSSLAPRVFTA